ncbi:MAG: metallophosphoesterase [bacterium]|nr:metallophosphoesterase [bacterium]
MKKWILVLFLLSLICGSAAASEQARGIVYFDENGNGIKDEGETGIRGVGVSNGTDVVLTDTQGVYELTVDEDDIIFVIQPSGYCVPVGMNNVRKFYYIHKPGGSPQLQYSGVAPTGPLPDSIDFPLLKGSDSENFKIIVFGDTQPRNILEIDYLGRDIVSELVDIEGYEFGMALGDVAWDNLDLHNDVNGMIGRIGIPWHYLMGNHDGNLDVAQDEYADERWEATYGPATYSYNYGKVHFIVFDDILYPDPRDNDGYLGGLRDEQLTFIENDLKHVPNDHLIVLSMHIPPFNENRYSNAFKREVFDRLISLLKPFPKTFSMAAHTHTQRHDFFKEGNWEHHHYVVGTSCGDWWSGWKGDNGIPDTMMRDGTPNGYALINFTGNEYTIDYKVAGKSADHRMNIYAPLVAPHNQSFRGEVYANVFLGSEKDRVEYRVDKGDWRRMRKVIEQDPAYVRLIQSWDSAPGVFPGRRPSNPIDCAHLWKAGMPTRLPVGAHVIEVRVTDMFGRIYSDFITYRIVDNR